MRWLSHLLGLILVIAIGTWAAGWWAVAVVGAAYGAWAVAERGLVLTTALAGAGAWGALLLYSASLGPVGRLSVLFGTVFRMSGVSLIVLTLAYAAFLAATSAACARGLRRLVTPTPPAGV
ncbi:MAG: hypothetical protein FJ363_06785 [Gemmatimonadetes bacterium]|nr:hypothetical protein [Gemmatimonadota bacterium]